MTWTVDATINGILFHFVRRRYSNRTFTWIHWRDTWHVDGKWQEYKGDPWPGIKIPRATLELIAAEIIAQNPPEEKIRDIRRMR